MIIDCFTFYNELDILEYRLNLLDDIVSYFILVEATVTFSGVSKKLFFEENKERFAKFLPKIIHVIATDLNPNPLNVDQIWDSEFLQRNWIEKGISQLTLKDTDVILISDLDEIPDPKTIITLSNYKDLQMLSLCLDLYYYNLRTKHAEIWTLSKILSYKYYRTELGRTPQKCRITRCPSIQFGGWHLSYFGDVNFIQNKIKHFSHQEFNNEFYLDSEKIKQHILKGDDLYNRNYVSCSQIPIIENKYLPPHYEKYLSKFL